MHSEVDYLIETKYLNTNDRFSRIVHFHRVVITENSAGVLIDSSFPKIWRSHETHWKVDQMIARHSLMWCEACLTDFHVGQGTTTISVSIADPTIGVGARRAVPLRVAQEGCGQLHGALYNKDISSSQLCDSSSQWLPHPHGSPTPERSEPAWRS